MRPPLVVAAILAGILSTKSSIIHAQNNTLKLCSETVQKARKAIEESKLPNQSAFIPLFDSSHQQLQQTHNNWAECVKGQKAPLLSFKTLTGESYNTDSLGGKIIVVNFWFMNCGPCRAEFPALNKLVEEYKGKNVLFLGFTPDKASTLKPSFFEQNQFDFSIVPNAQNSAESFYITGYPTTYIVDQRGIIHQAWIGFVGSGMDKLAPYHMAKKAIDDLLAKVGK